MIKTTKDLKSYISQKYPRLHPKKFDIVKVGVRIYMYYVDNEGMLARSVVFRGCLPTIDGVPKLKEAMDKLVDSAVKKWNP